MLTRKRSRWAKYAAVGLVVVLAVILVSVTHWSATATANETPVQPPIVIVSRALQGHLQGLTEFTGQFSAVDKVEIRAQVSGYLTEIHFTDGQIVHQGDLLFVIDPRPFAIQLQQATASVLIAKGQLLLAEQEVHRISALQGSGAVTKEQLDERVAAQVSAQGALSQANAAVAAAQLNLDYCHIRAPITGQISTHRVSIGNLVMSGPNGSTLLTTLVSLDPIHLDFQMSEDDYLNYLHYVHSARPGKPINDQVLAELSDESDYHRKGKLEFVDNSIDASIGTIHARAVFPNRDLMITPGDFADLLLPTSSSSPVLLVPDSAVTPDQSNEVVMTVAPDSVVVPKIVQTGDLQGRLREIVSGLLPSDRIIIDGLMTAMPGQKVTVHQGTISKQE